MENKRIKSNYQVKSTRTRVDRKKQQHQQQQKQICRSKVYVFYDEYKVIFWMLVRGLDPRILGLHVLRIMYYTPKKLRLKTNPIKIINETIPN
jgi:hypothetical protein